MGDNTMYGAVLCRIPVYSSIEHTLKSQKSIDMFNHGYLYDDWAFFQPFDCWLHEEVSREFVSALSAEHLVTLLHYYNSDDDIGYELEESGKVYAAPASAWGYRIYHEGECIARMQLRFDIEEWEDGFAEHIEQAYSRANIEAFSYLGVLPEVRTKLDALLQPRHIAEYMEAGDMMQLAAEFQALLGLDMAFRR